MQIMHINRLYLDDIDPLRMFTHETIFPDRKDHEENEQQEEKEKEDARVLELFLSMVKDKEVVRRQLESKILGSFRIGPNLAHLAELLNRSDVQGHIREKLRQQASSDPKKRSESIRVIENLKKLNSRIEKENSVWFRKVPLFARIYWQINKVNIPKD